ncbi:MAG: mechanosensitive ion channel, partial [Atopobiaceae bacterium]|nr:mechanosensitive ion channel [Atopobiaceae bacterium]
MVVLELAAWQSADYPLVACGLFYALLCVFSVVTGAMYLMGWRQLNPIELSDKMVRRLEGEGQLERFARIMGAVTIVVGIVQGASSVAILTAAGKGAYALALGFTLFSICSVLLKLRSRISAFPLLKLVAYLAILVVLILPDTRALFFSQKEMRLLTLGGFSLSAFTLVAAVAVGVIAARVATRLARTILGDSSVGEVSIVVNILRAVIAVTVIYFVGENVFHVELGGVVQALGVTTLVVSLGLQDLIKNVVAGVQVVLTHLFSVGDQLDVGSVRGEVMDVSWRQTVLRDKDGDTHVVPNATIMGATFMRREGKMIRRHDIECDIKPGLDLDRVAADIEHLADEVLDERGWRADEHAEVRFIGSTANGVQASIRVYLTDIAYTTRA